MVNAMSPPQNPEDPYANRNSEIYAGSLVLILLPTFFVILRLLSRWMAKANLWVSLSFIYTRKMKRMS